MQGPPATRPLSFRPAGPVDIPVIQTLANRIWRESYAAMLSGDQMDYMLAWMYGTDTIAAEMQAGVLWEVAALLDEAVGYLSLTPGAATAELNKLYLLPALQGRGHGQSLLARAQAIARERGAATLTLRVNKHNTRALRAYERAGFRQIDSIVADIGNGFVMDDHILARSLHNSC